MPYHLKTNKTHEICHLKLTMPLLM
uniref:Uncharacterized protein n=1 Tax=Rhizophora mucronata TaxID=61149 RepID=A0A2P2NPW4_RHIMU